MPTLKKSMAEISPDFYVWLMVQITASLSFTGSKVLDNALHFKIISNNSENNKQQFGIQEELLKTNRCF